MKKQTNLLLPPFLCLLQLFLFQLCFLQNAVMADDQSIAPRSSTRVALTYSIEVSRDGKPKANTRPTPGDQIKFHVQPNVDGYMYVIASTAGSGEYDVLYPAKGSRESNSVRKGQDYSFPGKGLTIGGTSGARSVRMVLSKTRLEAGPAMLMSRRISAGRVVENLGLTMPPRSALSEKHPSSFTNEKAVTVEVPEITEGNPLDLSIDFGSPSSDEGSTGKKPPEIAAAQPTTAQSTTAATGLKILPPIRNKWALLVGITTFKDQRWNLMYPGKDVRDFSNLLMSTFKFNADHVAILKDASASRSDVLHQLDLMSYNMTPGDLVFIYISTRKAEAAKDGRVESVLATSGTDPADPNQGSISEADLSNAIKKLGSKVRVIVLLDTNHFSGSTGNQPAFDLGKLGAETGQMILSTSTASHGETSHASLHYQNGIFIKHFMDGLRQNGAFRGALDYARKKTDQESMKDFFTHQTPDFKAPTWKWEDMKVSSP